jgi:REP element-mobilizing transposase RayT
MVQLDLPVRTRGGRRKGAGRPKLKGVVLHRRRPAFPGRFPLHITLKIRGEVGSLRTDKRFPHIKHALRYGCDRFGMRLIEFSVQGNHVHLIVEANDRRALSRGMQGLAIRLARGANRAIGRKGQVFADRYHARILRTVAEVRNAVNYVRKNWHKHQKEQRRWSSDWHVDPFSSMSGEACWYVDERARAALVVAQPATWLLKSHTRRNVRGESPTGTTELPSL